MPDLIEGILQSPSMQRGMPYKVITPARYPESRLRYPVLYLLHGLFGSFTNWTELTDLHSRAADLSLIIIMPEGGDGWYTDAGDGRQHESYVIGELIDEIDMKFRTIANRAGRGIAGNSMGGYGAFKFALKYPRLFSFAASMSGAFFAPQLHGPAGDIDWEELEPSIMKVFGSSDSETRKQNDLYQIAAGKHAKDLPYFYFDCGLSDGFISENRRLAETFADLGISHEFLELEGGHDWDYWNWRVRHLLELALQKLSTTRAF